MKKQKIFFFIGLWLMLMPVLGLPLWCKIVLTIISGLAIVILSYTLPGAQPFFKRVSPDDFEEEVLPSVPVGDASVHVLRITNEEKE